MCAKHMRAKNKRANGAEKNKTQKKWEKSSYCGTKLPIASLFFIFLYAFSQRNVDGVVLFLFKFVFAMVAYTNKPEQIKWAN